MAHVQPPCGKECPHRTPGCHSKCEAWGRYEIERNKEYEKRRKIREINAYHYEMTAKQQHKLFMKRRK